MMRTHFLAVALLTAVPALAVCTPTASGGPQLPEPTARKAPYVYVCSQQAAKISVIDVERRTVVATVDLQELGFPATAKPHHIAVEPDGSYWYVSLIGANAVLKFDAANRLVGQAEFEVPGMLALHPTRDLLLVGRSMSAVDPPQRIGLIRRSDMHVEELDVLYPRPHALTVHPGGAYAYSASLAQNRIGVVDLESEAVELVDVEGEIHTLVQFAVSPDGVWLVATGQLTGTLLVFDTRDPARPELHRVVEVNAQPWHPVFTPDGGAVYFGNKDANTVTVVDAASWTVTDVITAEGIAEPHGSAVTPDGRYVFVANNNLKTGFRGRTGVAEHPGTVVMIDTATREVEAVIEVPEGAAGLGIAAQ